MATRAAHVGNDMTDGRGGHQNPLPPGLAFDPRRGLVGRHHLGAAHLCADGLGRVKQGRLGARHDIGDGTFADRHSENLVQQSDEPLEADRLRDVQMDDQGLQVLTEG